MSPLGLRFTFIASTLGVAIACAQQAKRAPAPAHLPTIVETEPAPPPRASPRPKIGKALLVTGTEYLLPPDDVVSLLEREAPPEVTFHPGARRMTRRYIQKLVPREQMQRPVLALAGVRIDPNNLTRTLVPLGTRVRVNSLDAHDDAQELRPPDGALFGPVVFSPSGDYLAVPLVFPDRVTIAIFDFESGELEEVSTPSLSAVWGGPCRFVTDRRLLCTAPKGEVPPRLPPGPHIQELKSGTASARTYSDLLRNGADDALFEYYFSTRLLGIDLEDGTVSEYPVQGLLASYALSPDGRYLLASVLRPPYSRLLPASMFPAEQSIVELATGEVQHVVRPEPGATATAIPRGARLGMWDPRQPATVVYVERVADGDERGRDRVVALPAPFDAAPTLIRDFLQRVTHLGATSAGRLTLTDARSDRTWASFFVNGSLQPIHQGPDAESLGDLGRALRTSGTEGPVLEHRGAVYFVRDATRKDANYQELIRWDLETKSGHRVWNGLVGEHSEFLGVLSPAAEEFLVTRQTPQEPPSVVIWMKGKRRTVTRAPAPHPELAGVTRRLVRFKRNDGVMVSAVLYLPVEAKDGSAVPAVLWIYPREFDDAAAAGAPRDQDQRYFEVRGASRFALLTQGYAVLDLPSVPIVGEVKTGRDDFIPQLIEGTRAAVEHLVKLGVTQTDQVAVMGRSYGAFSVANLMAHSRLFKTGVAVSGAYNRTLTPFGFQNETRSFWQSTEAYVNLSPFFFADKISGSLLLIHGEQDENPGTPALQSERFYAALVGNGVRARYVALPWEGHQFRGRDATLHTSAETIQWLDAVYKSGR